MRNTTGPCPGPAGPAGPGGPGGPGLCTGLVADAGDVVWQGGEVPSEKTYAEFTRHKMVDFWVICFGF